MCLLTFDHHHVDIYGANGRLRQTLPFLQYVRDFTRGDAVVRLASECHQLPDGHSWRGEGGRAGQKGGDVTGLDGGGGMKTGSRISGGFLFSSHRCECKKQFSPTVTPHVTLMGELPVVDALQSHPFNGHLGREGSTHTHTEEGGETSELQASHFLGFIYT